MVERYQLSGESFRSEFPKVVADYFQLPSYVGNAELFDLQAERQQIGNFVAEEYYNTIRNNAWGMARKRDYPEAVIMVRQGLEDFNKQGFDEQDTRVIKIFFLRRLAKIYEYWATYGEEDRPVEDKSRQQHYLLAAYNYMLADIELGVMTEFASRVSECFRGMGLHEVGVKFDTAFWGGGNSYASGYGDLDVQIYTQHGEVTGEEESGAINIENWMIDLPDIDSN